MKKKVLAVIQARGGSKGIPKKNIYPINGHPLISYTISAALNSKYITKLIVSTDSLEIAEISKKYGADVPFLRPKKLSGDKVLSVDSLIYAVEASEEKFNTIFDYIIEIPCVAPLRDHKDINQSIELMIKYKCDSVISLVNTGEKHPVRLKKITNNSIQDFCKEFPEPGQNSRRQDLKPASYIRNGAIYLVERNVLLKDKSRHGKNSVPYIMSTEKSVNIDSFEDLQIAEYKIKYGNFLNKPNLVINNTFFYPKKDAKKILITTNLSFAKKILDDFRQRYDCIYSPGADRKTTIKYLKDIDVWLCSPTPKYVINKELLSMAKKLDLIVTPSTGSNHIDKNECKKRKIKVISLKGSKFVNTIYASSEFAFTLLLSTIRKLPSSYNSAISGKWREVENNFRSIELKGKNIGIVGFGRIGNNVAKYSISMGMNVICYDPYKKIKNKKYHQVNSTDLLLSKSDIVLIAVHLDNTTKNMVNKHWFDKMKRGSFFINISRGDVVDEQSLIRALKSKKISAAGLDVIKNELSPSIEKSPIIKYAKKNENLVITPHIAGLTIDSEIKAAKFSLKEIIRYHSKENVC